MMISPMPTPSRLEESEEPDPVAGVTMLVPSTAPLGVGLAVEIPRTPPAGVDRKRLSWVMSCMLT